MFRFLPGSIRPGVWSRAGARLYPLTAFVHLPYSPTITRAISGGRKMPVVGKCGRSGAGVRTAALFRDPFRDPFQGWPIRSHPINIGRVPRIRAAASGRVVDRSKCFVRILTKAFYPGAFRASPDPITSDQSDQVPRPARRGCESCTGRAAAPLPFRGGNIEGRPAGGGPGFFGTAGTCRATVPESGRAARALGPVWVAYVAALWRLRDTLPGAPRETALFPVHCFHSSLPGRYASAAYKSICGGTTGNMPRIPGGGVRWNVAICCGAASSLFVGSVFQYGSPCFASG